MILRRTKGPDSGPDSPVEKPEEPVLWTARYTAVMDDGTTRTWERGATWESKDRFRAAGDWLLALKYGSYSQVLDGKLYPPHRLREVTWEVVDGPAA